MKPEIEERYSRQVLFRGIGQEGQRRLLASRIAIVGCGATGSALASLLARAGVGYLRIIDRDYVETSNLQRQSLFDEGDAAESLPKAIAASRRIRKFNSQICAEPHVSDLNPENSSRLLSGVELILDGTDNFDTRYLVNDYAVKNSLPWIYIAAVGGYAATMNIVPGETACLACIFAEAPAGLLETCDTAGILSSAVDLAASLAAAEAIKLLVGATNQLRRTLFAYDVWQNERAEVSAEKPRPDCRACGRRDFVHLAWTARSYATLCGRDAVQIRNHEGRFDLGDLSKRLAAHGRVRHNDFVLKFDKEPYEMTVFPDGRAIIKGTTDTASARSFYARYIGT
jgi:molybdopterin-synthase adenylyltransferase